MVRQLLMTALLVSVICCIGQEPNAEDIVTTNVKVTLSDGSQLRGTLQQYSLALITAFGKQEIPFALIAALDFTKDEVKVKFRNQDVLTGKFEGDSVALQTVFNSVRLSFSQIKGIQVLNGQGVTRGNEQGLLLHALLNSDNEDLGVFNAHMTAQNARVIEGPSGNALLLDSPKAKISIELPFSPYLMPEGTIEFWAKLPQPHRPFGGGRGQPWLFNLEFPGSTYHSVFGFAQNEGAGGSGLIGRLHGLGLTATHSYGVVSTVAETGILGDTPDGWHHYAFIWKRDGIKSSEGLDKTIILLVDCEEVASFDQVMPVPMPDATTDPNTKIRLVVHDSNSDNTRPIAMSDLKIWNYAKLPD